MPCPVELFSYSFSLFFPVFKLSKEDLWLRATLHAIRLELAAVRAAHGLQSGEIAEKGGESAQPDDETNAHIAEDDGDFPRCAELYRQAAGSSLTLPELGSACDSAHGTGEARRTEELRRGCDSLLSLWRQADLLVAAAHCHRRAMHSNSADIGAADTAVESALRLFPRHTDALHAKGMSFISALVLSVSHKRFDVLGMALLDSGRPRAALNVFQRLLRLRREDPDHPSNSAAELQSVLPWLVRAHAAVLRQATHADVGGRSDASFSQPKKMPGSPGTGFSGLESDAYDHYRVLRCVLTAIVMPGGEFVNALCIICGRLPSDFTTAQLHRAYRTASLRAHPDRGGSSAAFATVAAALETLADGDRRARYDRGDADVTDDGTALRLEDGMNHSLKIIDATYHFVSTAFLRFRVRVRRP